MFSSASLDLGTNTDLRLFLREDRSDSYVITSDLAAAFGVQSPSIRGEMSKHNLGTLESVPELKLWLRNQNLIPLGTGKLQFASSSVWHRVVERHVAANRWTTILQAYNALIAEGEAEGGAEGGGGELSPSLSGVSPTQPVGSCLEDQGEADGADCELVVEMDLLSGNDSDVDFDIDSDNDHANDSDNDSDIDSDGSDSSSDSSGIVTDALPVGVESWVLSAPQIPALKAFLPKHFTKSYSLKPYDMRKSLKKELKKQKKWWTRHHNSERPGKAVGVTTALKREERNLCFLGFVERYKVLSAVADARMTLALYLNHRLFSSYLDYLRIVRRSSEGTLAEAITAAISACHWLFRKQASDARLPSIIRRYMDWRNEHQRRAARDRQGKDKEELVERNKWVEWAEFLRVVHKLRSEWLASTEEAGVEPSLTLAHQLHDLVLLGLYSCIPSRGNETRLLQYFTEEELRTIKKEHVPFKTFVEAQRMNLIVQTSKDDTWKIYCANFKNIRSMGSDCTELRPFGWWTDLFETYISTYRPILLKEASQPHNYVFVTRGGDPFSGPYFSEFLSTLLYKHTGKRVATNGLRSSFITSFYGSEAAKDPEMRESVARVMRHSSKEAQRTYDRRTATERKRKGLDLLAVIAEKRHAKNSDPSPPLAEEDATISPIKVGAVVVEFQRHPHQVILRNSGGDAYLLARMTRSSTTNAPVYHVSPAVCYEWRPVSECKEMLGLWEGDEFELI